MQSGQKIMDEIYREKIERARQMDPDSKIMEGPRLFDMAAKFTLAGIKSDNPGIGDKGALDILRQRLEIRRQMDRKKLKNG